MPNHPKQWQEKEWERYVNQLLSTHHAIFGGSYQPVPDYGGDGGLEGFTSDTGEAYQSYADQNSKNNEERTRKQKKKIREDLQKLETNSEFWKEMLGDTVLKHWTLIVPNLDDKEVVKYAKAKARQLAKKGVPFIAPSFFADAKSAEDFPVAQTYVRTKTLPRSESADVTDEQVAAFQQEQPEFIQHLKRKLMKVTPSAPAETIDRQIENWLKWHLKSANLLDGLLHSFPTLWEAIDELIDVTAQALVTDELLDTRLHSNRLRETRQGFESQLASAEFEFLATTDRTVVSHGVVAKWLGECPLDFSGGSND